MLANQALSFILDQLRLADLLKSRQELRKNEPELVTTDTDSDPFSSRFSPKLAPPANMPVHTQESGSSQLKGTIHLLHGWQNPSEKTFWMAKWMAK